MALTIRPYEPQDYAACRALWVELNQHHRDIYGDPEIGGNDPGAELDAHLARHDLAGVWLAVEGAAVLGLCGLLVDGEEGEIEPIVVTRGSRSAGVGRALLEYVTRESALRGVRFLGLRPVARNDRAIELFIREGFDILGHVELFKVLPAGDARTWRDGAAVLSQELRS